jgi:hypothetical protein
MHMRTSYIHRGPPWHVFVVTKGTKHGLRTLFKVEKGASPS